MVRNVWCIAKSLMRIIDSSRHVRGAGYTLDNLRKTVDADTTRIPDSRRINVSIRKDRRNEIFDGAERAENSHDRSRLDCMQVLEASTLCVRRIVLDRVDVSIVIRCYYLPPVSNNCAPMMQIIGSRVVGRIREIQISRTA